MSVLSYLALPQSPGAFRAITSAWVPPRLFLQRELSISEKDGPFFQFVFHLFMKMLLMFAELR